MKSIFSFLICFAITIFFTLACCAQESSLLYDQKRRLKADNSIRINQQSYDTWQLIEKDFIYAFTNGVEHPAIFRDAGIDVAYVLSFQFNHSKGFHNVKIEKNISEHQVDFFPKSILKAATIYFDSLNNSNWNKVQLQKIRKSTLQFYLPLSYKVKTVDQLINKEGTIERTVISPPPIRINSVVH